MTMETSEFDQQLRAFLDASPTPFHAVSSMGDLLTEAGFTQLSETDAIGRAHV